ncbi:MAG TPA: alpha/beta hydrolase [Polyangia bacterium]
MPTSTRLALGTGLQYHLLEWGAEDPARDHTVILLHGFLDLAYGWVPTVEAGLGARFHVVAPDLRGHGDSDRIGAGGYYHFFDYLADLDELIRARGRKRVSLVGHSMGGSIAAYFTGTFPSRIHKLALLEGLGPPESGDLGPERTATWIESWRRVRERPQRSYATVEEAASRLRENDRLLDAALALELAQAGTVRGRGGRFRFKHDPLHATLGPYAFQVEAACRFWKKITCPVLLVEGDRSDFRLAPEDDARRRACFPHAARAVVEGAGHMMQRHQPARLARLLVDFLSSESAGPAYDAPVEVK